MTIETVVNTGKNVPVVPHVIGQRVKIGAIDTVGIIKRITFSSGAVEYMVRCFDDDKVSREEWMEANEVERL